MECKETELYVQINKSKNPLEYMKEVSEITSLKTEDGTKLLSEYLSKVFPDRSNDALSIYLKKSEDNIIDDNVNLLIFPFGGNTSQYFAVKNAINNKVSVIEGPPGTGKTQTILNIISNLIIRGMNCQVVSNNNTAIKNIDDKLKENNLDFIEALMGKKENKENFILNQKLDIPDFKEYENMNLEELNGKLINVYNITQKVYEAKKIKAEKTQEKTEMVLSYNHFKLMINDKKINIKEIDAQNRRHLLDISNHLSLSPKISIWQRLKYIFIYKIGDFDFYKLDNNVIYYSIKNAQYKCEINNLEKIISQQDEFIKNNEKYEKEYIKLSIDYLKKYLSIKYNRKRKIYSLKEIKNDYTLFIKDYPVILSTTYSSKNTFKNEFKFDYIIMDEASQVDVVTGTLALSSGKNAVIIGDEKQLPNVIPESIKEKVNSLSECFDIDRGYFYSINSFLSSVKKIIPNAPQRILKEHYRCHPKIINFCNEKFYNNELIIMTEDKDEENVIKVIRTNKGNHSRGKHSQRQIDIIKDILPTIQSDDIGIIAPYNEQVELIKAHILEIETSTVHKFQGKEKDVIIISTVDDNISDFVANSNILNVAISRAKKQLYFIVTGNEINNRNISDFIDYVIYNNMEITESTVYSVFDLLYKQYEKERAVFFQKHQRKTKYDSENLIYHLLKDLMKEYNGLKYDYNKKMSELIKDMSILTEDEKKYVSHPNTHIDFLIMRHPGNKPVLAIEVDSNKYHKEGTKQYERDQKKNEILRKYNIPLERLSTEGSNEEAILRNRINEILSKADKI